MAIAEASKSSGMGKYLVVYLCLLALAGFQFALAFENIDTSQMLVRMLAVAIVEAGLAMMFFMHLGTEKRGFTLFVLVFTIFVLLALQYGWTDSTRMVVGAPFSK
ncbi:MAG TPA: cytochrome C oxidase subunit IV family protein [Candidatus Sulfotelmatobacter sp.]|jgi:caa(3)-type oxidase subunit IV|nr:cytochrome C oxidase subunit IV family protein [Candidatus Sulfotelmatobacter sp.]